MSNVLRGTVVNPNKIYGKSAYEIAVMHGYDGTEAEWIASVEANRVATEEAKDVVLESEKTVIECAQSARASRDEAVRLADNARVSGEYAYQCLENAHSYMDQAQLAASAAEQHASLLQASHQLLVVGETLTAGFATIEEETLIL